MRTSDPAIFAVGDAVQVHDPILGQPALVPLAGPANRQARIAADNACGRISTYRGTQGTSIVRVFGLAAARTGATEKALRGAGIKHEKVYIHPLHHAGYFPGAKGMTLKLLFALDGKVLGAQAVGPEGVDKRIDVIAAAIQARMTVFDLEEMELAYAPQFGSAKDPVNMAGFVAADVLRGDVKVVHAEAVRPDAFALIDVRTPTEHAAGHIPGSVNIPVDDLRARIAEVPRDRPVAVYCQVGLRGYLAARILKGLGIPSWNLSGGWKTWCLHHPPAP
jgi:rhodanese-related sulfurtransferase